VRPPSTILAAAIVVAMGVFLCITLAPTAVLLSLHPEMPPKGPGLHEYPPFGPPMSLVIEHILPLLAFEGLLGLASIACAIGIWLGGRWARRGSQIAMGILLLLWLGGGVLMALSFSPPPELGRVGSAFSVFFGVASLAVSIVWGSITALPIWLLERQATREYFEHGWAA
jgi:hypothetical protein